MKGLFITFEGIDGAGKSTHIEKLAQIFNAQGRVVTLTREPGGTALAEEIRTMVLNKTMDSMTEVLLVFAARRDHVREVIEPALERGEVVLCDRFSDSSFAYQGGGRGFSSAILTTLEQWVQGFELKGYTPEAGKLLQPDLSIWFDLSAAVAARRLANTRTPDKFESQPVSFFDKVVQAYTQRFLADPLRFARINADQDCAFVWADIHHAIRSKGWLL